MFRLPEILRVLERPDVLLVLAAFAVLELLNDKIRTVAVISNTFLTFIRPVAAVVSCVGVLPVEKGEGTAFVVALVLGLLVGSPIIRLRAQCVTNPLDRDVTYSNRRISLWEDILTPVSAFLAFLQPMLILVLTLGYTLYLISVRKKYLDKPPVYGQKNTSIPSICPQEPTAPTDNCGYGKIAAPAPTPAAPAPPTKNKRRL